MARTNIAMARTNIATVQTNIATTTAQKLFTAEVAAEVAAEVTFFVPSGPSYLGLRAAVPPAPTRYSSRGRGWNGCTHAKLLWHLYWRHHWRGKYAAKNRSLIKIQKNNDVLLPLWRVCRRISQLLYEVWKRYANFLIFNKVNEPVNALHDYVIMRFFPWHIIYHCEVRPTFSLRFWERALITRATCGSTSLGFGSVSVFF